MNQVTPVPGTPTGTAGVPDLNGTTKDGEQNGTKTGEVKGAPFPGILPSLLAVLGGCALLYRLKK